MTALFAETPQELASLIGRKAGPTESLIIDQKRINQFADATGDHQWIHVDPVKAADGPFGKTIAHGYLSLSLASYFLPQLAGVKTFSMGVNYGVDNVRFPSAVPVDSEVYAEGEVISVEESKGGYRMIFRMSICVKGQERPACVADTISVFYP